MSGVLEALGMLAFGFLFGGFLVPLGVYRQRQGREAVENAVERSGAVVEATVEEGRRTDGGGRTKRPAVTVEYRYGGRTRRSDNYYPPDNRAKTSGSWANRVVRRYDEGDEVTVYVDPDRPDEGFLRNGPNTTVNAMLVVCGAFAMVVTGLIAAASL